VAAVIFHGPPGSYKTSSCLWFEMLTALRAGRIVLTNIEGVKPIDEIEKELDERFPESADIWRVSTQKRKGLALMRRFFHWCPIGAQIIIDEVQDVFPVERTFKPDDYNYQPIESYKDHLKPEWYDTHKRLLEEIKPEELTSADSDDLGEAIFDDHGHIIYPSTLKESFMRHRKYNWDIVVCTPDITQVNMLIRGACEAAYHHSSKDAVGKLIPYYARRPRIRQHQPKENGLSARKSDVVTYRKVPLEVHKLYKSTSTGKITTSGVGKTPFQSTGFKLGAVVLVGCIVYFAFFLGGAFDADGEQTLPQRIEKDYQENIQRSQNSVDVPARDNTNKVAAAVGAASVFVNLPFEANAIHLTSYNKVYVKGVYQGVVLVFRFETDKGNYFLDSSDIENFGLTAKLVTDCIAKVSNVDTETLIMCSPDDDMDNQFKPDTTPSTNDSYNPVSFF